MHAFNHAQNHNAPNQGQNEQSRIVKQFRSYDPPVLNGHQDPALVETWIRSLERIFKLIGCTGAQCVDCAEYQLVDASKTVAIVPCEQARRSLFKVRSFECFLQ